jgi:heme oxygenase (staphylobilin-producing)
VIAVFNSLPVKEGAADEIVDRFAESRGNVQDFPGFVSIEVLSAEGTDEVMVITRWRDKADFDAWVAINAFKMAHGRGGGSGLPRGHPQMGTYEVAVMREPRASGD